MRWNVMLTSASLLAISGLLLTGGCDQYHPVDDAEPAAQRQPGAPGAQSGAPGAEGRASALGKAKDAGERTRDRMDDYQQRVLDEADKLGEP